MHIVPDTDSSKSMDHAVYALKPQPGEVLTMSSREIAELVESRHDNVKRTIERLAERGLVRFTPMEETSHEGAGARPVDVYRVGKRDSYVIVAQLSPEFTARLVDRWQKLEEELAANRLVIPDFSDPAAAARAWANEYEARKLAERTKAEIGSRREATAMNTASQAVKKADRLALELDRAHSYATIKRMGMLYHGQEFNWRVLKRSAVEMEIPAIDVFDANYGTVKAYHADVWREAYALEIPVTEA